MLRPRHRDGQDADCPQHATTEAITITDHLPPTTYHLSPQPYFRPLQKLLRWNRLQQHVGNSGGGASLARRGVVATRECHHRLRLHAAPTQRTRHLEPVAIGKGEVEEQEVGRIALAHRNGFSDRMRDRHAPPRFLEENSQRSRHQLIVLDNEHVRLYLVTPLLGNTGW